MEHFYPMAISHTGGKKTRLSCHLFHHRITKLLELQAVAPKGLRLGDLGILKMVGS